MTFLLITLTAWDEPPRARHQVARALAPHGPVVFVTRNGTGAPGLSERTVEDGITLLEPSWPLDYRVRYRLPVVNDLYQRWLLDRVARRHRDARVVCFDHTAAPLRRYFPDYTYFCNDDFIGNSKVRVPMADAYHRRTEAAVARHARTVLATSPYLVDKLRGYNPNAHELQLGAPSIRDELLAECRGVERGPGLQVGLVGFMGKRTSADLMNRLTAGEDIHLTLVGPVDPGFRERIAHPERVSFRGVLTGDDLYRAIAGFDVCIAPYDLAVINKGVTPNKMWQYLAVGRPVVITNLPNLAERDFPDRCVYVARNDDEFVELVRRADSEDAPEAVDRRIALARENSWDRRIERLLELMA